MWSVPGYGVPAVSTSQSIKQTRHTQNCEAVPSQSQCPVYSLLKACGSQCFPHQPEFEGIRTPAALNGLVTSVIADVVELVLLEQVCSLGRVTLLQEALLETQNRHLDKDFQTVLSSQAKAFFSCLYQLLSKTELDVQETMVWFKNPG